MEPTLYPPKPMTTRVLADHLLMLIERYPEVADMPVVLEDGSPLRNSGMLVLKEYDGCARAYVTAKWKEGQ